MTRQLPRILITLSFFLWGHGVFADEGAIRRVIFSQPQTSAQLLPLSETKLSSSVPPGRLPANAEIPAQSSIVESPNGFARNWAQSTYTWESPGLFHRPLYFEDVNAERYGNSVCPALQPIASGARFFATVPILPYKMSLERPSEPIYVLGYYRPGDRAPNLGYRPPLRVGPGIVEAGVVAGAILLFP